MDFLSTSAEDLEVAIRRLRRGGVVALPTDTVYGLAASALDVEAMGRLYEVKGRPSDQPLILFPAGLQAVYEFAVVDDRARLAMERHWPGPLTLILPATGMARPPLGTAGARTLGVRIPDHPVARGLAQAMDGGLATTSANRSGRPPALTAREAAGLPGLDAVVDGGPAPGGTPSTVIDLTCPEARIVRLGAVPLEALRDLLGPKGSTFTP